MKSRLTFGAVALLCLVASAGCEKASAPTSPTPTPTTSPFTVSVAGLYSGTTTLSSVSGGECVGEIYNAQLAAGVPDVGTVTITQDRSDVKATTRSMTNGLTCRYEGNASLNNFALTETSCTGDESILYQCSNGAARVLELVGSTMTGTVSGTTTRGVIAFYYNVFSDSTEKDQRKPVAGLILQHNFAAGR
jgi:hypothetical protein